MGLNTPPHIACRLRSSALGFDCTLQRTEWEQLRVPNRRCQDARIGPQLSTSGSRGPAQNLQYGNFCLVYHRRQENDVRRHSLRLLQVAASWSLLKQGSTHSPTLPKVSSASDHSVHVAHATQGLKLVKDVKSSGLISSFQNRWHPS